MHLRIGGVDYPIVVSGRGGFVYCKARGVEIGSHSLENSISGLEQRIRQYLRHSSNVIPTEIDPGAGRALGIEFPV